MRSHVTAQLVFLDSRCRLARKAVVLAAVMVAAGLDRRADIGPAVAEAAALDWVGVGFAQEPRRDGDEWEVDVIRPDGSMVEVTIGDAAEMRGLDEERGPAGLPAHDEVHGPLRALSTKRPSLFFTPFGCHSMTSPIPAPSTNSACDSIAPLSDHFVIVPTRWSARNVDSFAFLPFGHHVVHTPSRLPST